MPCFLCISWGWTMASKVILVLKDNWSWKITWSWVFSLTGKTWYLGFVRFFNWSYLEYGTFVCFLCVTQSEGDLWRFHLEAQTAYTCKGILGLCHFLKWYQSSVDIRIWPNLWFSLFSIFSCPLNRIENLSILNTSGHVDKLHCSSLSPGISPEG